MKRKHVVFKEAGTYAYSHNLDTSEKFYPRIITTRTYQDRLNTLKAVREAEITVCCGGILGDGRGGARSIRAAPSTLVTKPAP